MNEDIVMACIDLIDRCGASGFEMGFLNDDVAVEDADWWAHAEFRGARILVEHQSSPTTAALTLAQRLLTGATCRCLQPVALSDDQPGCRWKLMGSRWEPSCNAPPLKFEGKRGDYAGIRKMLDEPTNRAQRRRRKK